MVAFVKLLLHVIFPGATGFAMSYLVVIPVLVTATAATMVAGLMAIAATGLLTFVFAALVRGSLVRVTERYFPRLA